MPLLPSDFGVLPRRERLRALASRFGLPDTAEELLDAGGAGRPGRGRRFKTFRHPGLAGWFTAVISAADLHYQDEDGEWDEIDLTFQQQPVTGSWILPYNSVVLRVSGAGLLIGSRETRTGIAWLGTGFAVSADARTVTLVRQGLTWTWTPGERGVKLTAQVAASRGSQTYVFPYALVGENQTPLTVDAEGNLVGNGFAIPRATVLGADGIVRQCGPWQLLTGPLRARFTFDDSALPSGAFPYTLDPTTTFTVRASADDGYAERVNSVAYPPNTSIATATGSTTITVMRTFFSSVYGVRVGLLRFDTSALGSSALISSAILRLYITNKNNTNSRNVNIEYYAASNWPIDAADYTDAALSTAHGSIVISSLAVNADNDFALSSPDSNINKTGYTGFRLHVSGGQPSGLNDYAFATIEGGGSALGPRLIVTYTTNQNVERTVDSSVAHAASAGRVLGTMRGRSSTIAHTSAATRALVGTRAVGAALPHAAAAGRTVAAPRAIASTVGHAATAARAVVASRGLGSALAHTAAVDQTRTLPRGIAATLAHATVVGRVQASLRALTSAIGHATAATRPLALVRSAGASAPHAAAAARAIVVARSAEASVPHSAAIVRQSSVVREQVSMIGHGVGTARVLGTRRALAAALAHGVVVAGEAGKVGEIASTIAHSAAAMRALQLVRGVSSAIGHAVLLTTGSGQTRAIASGIPHGTAASRQASVGRLLTADAAHASTVARAGQFTRLVAASVAPAVTVSRTGQFGRALGAATIGHSAVVVAARSYVAAIASHIAHASGTGRVVGARRGIAGSIAHAAAASRRFVGARTLASAVAHAATIGRHVSGEIVAAIPFVPHAWLDRIGAPAATLERAPAVYATLDPAGPDVPPRATLEEL